MYWHIDADIISLAVIIALCIYNTRLVPEQGSAVRNRRFLLCLWAGILASAVDIAASIVMDVPSGPFLYHLLLTMNFGMLELLIVVWVSYAIAVLYHDTPQRIRPVTKAALAPYLVFLLLVCSNPWTGLLYELGPNHSYQRGPLFAVMVVLFALYAVFLLVLVLLRRAHMPFGYPSWLLLLMPALLAMATAVQLSVPGWLMLLPSYMICLVLAFLFLQTLRVKRSEVLMQNLSVSALTDPLTGLYNRKGVEECMLSPITAHRGNRCMAVIVDVDDLKRINDTLGHAEGDLALQAVAKQLKNHFRATDIVARFGGDEFLVFLAGDLSEAQSHLSLSRLVAELSALTTAGCCTIPCSVGAAMGTIGTDDFMTLCTRADAALYHVKRGGKNGYALYTPDMGERNPERE